MPMRMKIQLMMDFKTNQKKLKILMKWMMIQIKLKKLMKMALDRIHTLKETMMNLPTKLQLMMIKVRKQEHLLILQASNTMRV